MWVHHDPLVSGCVPVVFLRVARFVSTVTLLRTYIGSPLLLSSPGANALRVRFVSGRVFGVLRRDGRTGEAPRGPLRVPALHRCAYFSLCH
jgi:hypothetical protein